MLLQLLKVEQLPEWTFNWKWQIKSEFVIKTWKPQPAALGDFLTLNIFRRSSSTFYLFTDNFLFISCRLWFISISCCLIFLPFRHQLNDKIVILTTQLEEERKRSEDLQFDIDEHIATSHDDASVSFLFIRLNFSKNFSFLNSTGRAASADKATRKWAHTKQCSSWRRFW